MVCILCQDQGCVGIRHPPLLVLLHQAGEDHWDGHPRVLPDQVHHIAALLACIQMKRFSPLSSIFQNSLGSPVLLSCWQQLCLLLRVSLWFVWA